MAGKEDTFNETKMIPCKSVWHDIIKSAFFIFMIGFNILYKHRKLL